MKKTKQQSFRLTCDFKTGNGVTVPRDTVGTVIPKNANNWTMGNCIRLAIPCEPKEILAPRHFVEPVVG